MPGCRCLRGSPSRPRPAAITCAAARFRRKSTVDGRAWRRLEKLQGQKLGDAKNPLLVSVRSGAKFSMPGMMDTILNLGLNDETVEGLARAATTRVSPTTATAASSRCSATSCWRFRRTCSSTCSTASKKKKKAKLDTDLDASGAAGGHRATTRRSCKKHGKRDFPQDPHEQLVMARDAVFRSWVQPTRQDLSPHQRHRRHRARPSTCRRWCSATWATTSGTGVASRAIRRPARRSSTASS